MSEIRRVRTVAATPEAVWEVLADFGGIARWADNVAHSSLLRSADGPAGVGTIRRVQVGRNTLTERIVEAEEPNVLAYDIGGLPPRLQRANNRWALEPVGDATEVSLTTTIDLGPRPPQQLAARVVARVFARQSDTMLAGLAHHLEERP